MAMRYIIEKDLKSRYRWAILYRRVPWSGVPLCEERGENGYGRFCHDEASLYEGVSVGPMVGW